MTLDQFTAVLKSRRIPTPPEFVAFVAGQGWRIEVDDTGAFLRAKVKDRAALLTAKMLSREPWRTNVLRLVTGGEPPKPYTPTVEPVAVPGETPASDPEPEPVAESDRDAAIGEVFERARAAGKVVYGFSSAYPSCRAVSRKDIPADFDGLCVEGEAEWTRIPT